MEPYDLKKKNGKQHTFEYLSFEVQ